jgi:hypothetical protein
VKRRASEWLERHGLAEYLPRRKHDKRDAGRLPLLCAECVAGDHSRHEPVTGCLRWVDSDGRVCTCMEGAT